MVKKSDAAGELSFAERRKLAQQNVRKDLNKSYGEDSSAIASEAVSRYRPRISSGSFLLDLAMGGGWPRGLISLVWGSFSSGKTSTMLRTIADAQKRDVITNRYIEWMSPEEKAEAVPMTCAWVDVEGSFDREWASRLGVNIEQLEYARPASQEEACTMVESYMLSGGFDVVVLDSLAAMASEKEVEGEMGSSNVGVAARNNNQMFRKVQSAMNRMAKTSPSGVPTFFFINQERNKIGVMYGSPLTKPGGVGQDFFTSVVVHLSGSRVEHYDEKEKTLPKWVETGFRVEKNKTCPPRIDGKIKQGLVDDPNNLFSAGEIYDSNEVLDMAEKLGVYEKVSATCFKMFGKSYKRKMDLTAEWIDDRNRFQMLKGALLSKLLPYQENDWKFHVPKEKETAKSSRGDAATET